MEEPYKRFLVLMDDRYYPAECTGSIIASFDTLDEAVAMAKTKKARWGDNLQYTSEKDYAEVFDCDQRRVVWEAE